MKAVMVIVFLSIGLAIMLAIAFKPAKVSVVAFDSKHVHALFIRQLAEQKAGDEKIRAATRKFHASLEKVLVAYARKHKVVIADQKYILAGAPDITAEIIELLALEMGGEAS